MNYYFVFFIHLICLVLWHFFHIFGMCLLQKHKCGLGVGGNQSVLWPSRCIQKSCDLFFFFSFQSTHIYVKEIYDNERNVSQHRACLRPKSHIFFCFDEAVILTCLDCSSSWPDGNRSSLTLCSTRMIKDD